MAEISPPESIQGPLINWMNVYRVPYYDQMSIGHVAGTEVRGWTETIENLDALAGEVAFFGNEVTTPEPTPFPSETGKSFYIVSNDNADNQYVNVRVHTNMAVEKIERVRLTGTTPVLIPDANKNVHVQTLTVEGTATTQGDLFVSEKAVAGTPLVDVDNVQIVVERGANEGSNPTIKCPGDQVILIDSVDFNTDKNDGAVFRCYVERTAGVGGANTRVKHATWYVYEASFQYHFNPGLALTKNDSFTITVQRSDAGTGNIDAAVNMQYYVLKADDIPGVSSDVGTALFR